MTRTILSVVVGSQLHSLADENSDTDLAHVVITPLRTILSPFVEKLQPKQVIGDEQDQTTYELKHFCKLLAQGNPTVLEVLWSNKIHFSTPLSRTLQTNRQRFLHSRRIFDAHRGYARNQRLRIDRAAPDEISGEVNDLRRGKLAAATIRVYCQGISLLTVGTFSPQLRLHRDLLLQLKRGVTQEEYVALGLPLIDCLEEQITRAYEERILDYDVDVDWIEEFVYNAYVRGG